MPTGTCGITTSSMVQFQKKNKLVKPRRRAHGMAFRVCFHGNWEHVLSRSPFARTETGHESLDRGAPQPGGPPVVKAALVPLHFHAPPGKRREKSWRVEATGSLHVPKTLRSSIRRRRRAHRIICLRLFDVLLSFLFHDCLERCAERRCAERCA